MHSIRAIVPLSLALAWSASCGRTDEPGSTPRREAREPSPQPEVVAPAVSRPGSPARAEARCVVQTSAEPAPKAERAKSCPQDPTGNLDLPKGSVTFADAPGKPRISVEIAREDQHRSRGLMYRTKMSDTVGMLFSWHDEDIRSFWMHNTCIPLDMLFIARDGTIVGILEQVPTLNKEPRSIPCPAAYVLEVNAGWTRARGVRAGQKVVIDA